MNEELRLAIIKHAKRIGADPVDFANVISYETGGTFDPWQKGPTTKWGQHVGLIQMGGPQREKYGYKAGKSVDDLVGASANYLTDNGYTPGMGLLDMYSTINAGAPGRYAASDVAAGGAPGNVADKVNDMMGAHRNKATALLGGEYSSTIKSSAPYFAPPMGDVAPTPGVSSSEPPPYIDNTAIFKNAPLSPQTAREQYVQENMTLANDDDTASLWGGVKAAVNNNWSIAYAMAESPTAGSDPDFRGPVKAEAFKQMSQNMPEQYWDGLLEADSLEQMEQAKSIAVGQLKNDQTLASMGWGGVALNIGAAVLDPVAIGVSVGSEGLMAPMLAAAKVGRVGRILATGFTAGTSNLAAEAAVGIWNPRVNSETMAESFGIGMLLGGAFGALGKGGQVLSDEARQAIDVGLKQSLGSSAGAQRVAGTVEQKVFGNLIDDIENGDVTPSAFDSARFDVVARLSASGDDGVRLLGRYLAQESVGLKGNGEEVLETAASVRKQILQHSSLNNLLDTSVVPSYRQWVARKGIRENDDTWLKFNEDVTAFRDNKDPTAEGRFDAEVRAANAGYEKFYDRFWALANNPGAESGKILRPIPGFAEIKEKYRPMYSDTVAIHRMRTEIGETRMVQLVKEAITSQLDDVEDELVDRMARGYVSNISRVGFGGNTGLDDALARGERAELLDFMNTQLNLSSDDSEALVEKIMQMAKRQNGEKSPTSRGKRRTAIDYNHSVTWNIGGRNVTYAVKDFFVKDAHMIAKRYADEMSGHVALAQMVVKHPKTGKVLVDGITTKAEWGKLIEQIGERFATKGGGPKRSQEAINRLNYIYDHLTGKPRLGQQASESWLQWSRRLATVQFLRLMQNMGITQAQEAANIASSVGLKAFWQGVPAFGKALRLAKDGSVNRDEVVQELMSVTGLGYDNYLNAFRYQHLDDAYGEVFGTSKLDRAGVAFDKLASKGKRVVANISLMKHVNTTLQQWAMRSIAQKVANLAFKHGDKIRAGKFKLNDINTLFGFHDANRMRLLGWDDKSMGLIMKNMLEKTDGAATGKRLTALNLDQWDPEARAAFIEGLHDWTGRVIQHNDIGNLAKWMTHPMAQIFAQFRTFIFGAYAKQTLHGIKHFDPRTLVNVSLQLAAGAGTWYLINGIRSLGEKNPEKFMEDRTSWGELTKAGISRAGISSIIPMFVDQGYRLGMGKPLLDYRTSGTPTSGVMSSPLANHFDDLSLGIAGIVDMLKDGRKPSQAELKRLMRATLGNHLALNTVFSAMISDLPKNAPKQD